MSRGSSLGGGLNAAPRTMKTIIYDVASPAAPVLVAPPAPAKKKLSLPTLRRSKVSPTGAPKKKTKLVLTVKVKSPALRSALEKRKILKPK